MHPENSYLCRKEAFRQALETSKTCRNRAFTEAPPELAGSGRIECGLACRQAEERLREPQGSLGGALPPVWPRTSRRSLCCQGRTSLPYPGPSSVRYSPVPATVPTETVPRNI